MKKISFLLLLVYFFISPVFADSSLTLEQVLDSYFRVVTDSVDIPKSYSSIHIKYTNISQQHFLYPLLQKAIYLDVFPNISMELPLSNHITQKQASIVLRYAFPFIATGSSRLSVSTDWITPLLLDIKKYRSSLSSGTASDVLSESDVYNDVVSKLRSSYYYHTGITQTGLLYWAIQGLVNSLDDPYTSFFPPTEADSFTDQLEGQFYGIGAYVEMSEPWVFLITATIDGTPAQKAGLRAWDRILQVDNHIIDVKTSSSQAVSWIKGPSGTTVSIKYLRDWKIFTIDVVRKKIEIPNIESKVFTWWKFPVCVITLRMFDLWVSNQFSKLIWQFSHDNCSKYIFDLRNNPWWSLQEVSTMLHYFVPFWEPVVSVKSTSSQDIYFSSPPQYSQLTGQIIRILVNWGSASASEIFAWVVREYVPNSLLVGQKTYGKWSVQNLVSYDDGSLFKYTVAKRYTGKKDINIDGIWFTPDVIIEDKVGTGKDVILDWALKN